MQILLIYKLETEAQGIQANKKRYIRPEKQNQNKNLFRFFWKFSQRKLCTHGYPRRTWGRGLGPFFILGWSIVLLGRLTSIRPIFQFPTFSTIFSSNFFHFSKIIQNLQNKIKLDKNLKNMIITSIKQVAKYPKNSSFLVRTNTPTPRFFLSSSTIN